MKQIIGLLLMVALVSGCATMRAVELEFNSHADKPKWRKTFKAVEDGYVYVVSISTDRDGYFLVESSAHLETGHVPYFRWRLLRSEGLTEHEGGGYLWSLVDRKRGTAIPIVLAEDGERIDLAGRLYEAVLD